jgi:hypothetical protein
MDWFDGKDNIAVVRYDQNGKVIPIDGNVVADDLEIRGSLYFLSPVLGNVDLNNAKIGHSVYAMKGKIGGCFTINSAKIINGVDLGETEIGNGFAGSQLKADVLNLTKAKTGSVFLNSANVDCFYAEKTVGGKALIADRAKFRIVNLERARFNFVNLEKTEIDELIAGNTHVKQFDFRGTRIRKLRGEFPKIEANSYATDRYTALPDSITAQLSDYGKIQKKH